MQESPLNSFITSLKLRPSIVVLDIVRQLKTPSQSSLKAARGKLRPSIVTDVASLL